jgi:hypothetical protein
MGKGIDLKMIQSVVDDHMVNKEMGVETDVDVERKIK